MISRASEEFLERALVLRFRDGDHAAFEPLVTLHHAELIYYVRGLLGKPDGADDVVQEVWLAAYRQMRGIKDVTAFRPWLYRIARNKAFDLLRTRPPRSIEDVPEPPAEDQEPQFRAEDAAQIHAALSRLSLEHREVLSLRFLKQTSYEQIAEITETDLGTVKSRIHYAKQSLRREMEKQS
jgi:RNA polymerase sigma-70 factor (ECF subfamily)